MAGPNTAEPAGEQLDIVSATGRYLRTADRREVHDGGHWHEVFHCVVVRTGEPARVILQRRHESKAAFPGLLDLSATGHLAAGETPADGVRELNEELGTEATADDLRYAGVRLLADDDGEGRNRERVHLFFATDDRAIDGFAPDPTEVQSLVEADVSGLLALIDQVVSGPNSSALRIQAVEWRPGNEPTNVEIGVEDFIKLGDGYWTVAMVMAKRFIEGLGPVAI